MLIEYAMLLILLALLALKADIFSDAQLRFARASYAVTLIRHASD